MTNTTVNEAVQVLEKVSNAFANAANKPEHENTDYAFYLRQMSFEMHIMKNEFLMQPQCHGDFLC